MSNEPRVQKTFKETLIDNLTNNLERLRELQKEHTNIINGLQAGRDAAFQVIVKTNRELESIAIRLKRSEEELQRAAALSEDAKNFDFTK